ncbi:MULTISPECIES: ABC transporter ATP-binding protein [Hungatella]|uniref:ATP-binding cassette domain-containing protein n=1 Tax=Hungatella hathewayi TaxID=154046 RepID=A0AAW9WEI2_9FIRM|nr:MULTISPECIES: ABC transporter ATP-binding protein [Hungatella]MCQ4829256.1 ABC transporter ATP-binding protein [Hungatella sp. SL.1.14]MUB63352.1 ATP-binding cassette domain-containing protein [Hungatella hathewayi]CUQ14633.1 ABC transporter [Hungatella hathewayi]
MEYAIELKELTKRFNQFTANDKISFQVEKGEIHALAGENGAGKTTLMNMIYGLYTPTSGELWINGEQVKFTSSRDSIARGIGMVHQHFMLVPKLTVAENIIAGQETGTALKLDRKTAEKQIAELSDQYGLKIDPSVKVGDLSVTMQQRVEILKVLYRRAEILIFDEPTAVLTPQEIDEFCDILLKLKQQGKTILFISHKLNEVMKISDHVTVIRLGKVIGTVKTSETTPEELTRMMVGRDISLGGGAREEIKSPKEILKIDHVSYKNTKNIKKVDDLSLSVKAGEILGIAGVDGNGQEELVEMICGLRTMDEGDILLDGESIKHHPTGMVQDMGIGYIPEDRHKDGLVLDFSIAENVILGQHRKPLFAKHGLIMKKKEIGETAEHLREQYDIRCSGVDSAASTLSGGNQQKIVIARAIFRGPKAILAVQPTRGLDVGAIEYIHKALVEQRNQGKAVLLLSLELDEILSLSDRIAVIHKGKIVGIVDAHKTTREELGLMMLGHVTGKEEEA